MTERQRPPTVEERFLVELNELRIRPEAVQRRPMIARFRARRYSGGPGGTDLSSGTIIPTRDAVMVYLWPVDADPGSRPVLTAHMVADPGGCWGDLDQPAPVMVSGRLAKGSALAVETDRCRLESLQPAKRWAWRAPRR